MSRGAFRPVVVTPWQARTARIGAPAAAGSVVSGTGPGSPRPVARAALGMLVGSALLAGCGSAPVAPLPGQWPSRTPAVTGAATVGGGPGSPTGPGVTPSRTIPPPVPAPVDTTRRTRTPAAASPTAGLSPACLPAVIYTVDGSDSAMMPRALCLTVAAILRIQNVGPGVVTATPTDKVTQQWEAGVVDCRMVRPGTVTVEVAGETGVHTITVLVVE